MSTLLCKLVERPAWSDPNEWANPGAVLEYEEMDRDEIESVALRREELKRHLHETLCEYVDDFEDVDNTDAEDPYEHYPNRFEMTGAYYINTESCRKDEGEFYYSFCVYLIAKPGARTQRDPNDLDYHGLEILLVIEKDGKIGSDGVVSSWG